MQKKEFDILILLSGEEKPTLQKIVKTAKLPLDAVNNIIHSFKEHEYYIDGEITSKGRQALAPYRVKRAIFLAAGMGSRLLPITKITPKPLVRVNGERMIDSLLDAVIAAEIPEIAIVRGYLGEQFDQLKNKYPQIRFVENPFFNESNNISSAVCVRNLLQNAYVLESDLILKNLKLIRKYEYQSNFLGIPVKKTNDWCFYTDNNGIITSQRIGGTNCYQMVGISYWSAEDGVKLANDLNVVYTAPNGKECLWEQTALLYKKENYSVMIRECSFDDVIEIDTYSELQEIDKFYALENIGQK